MTITVIGQKGDGPVLTRRDVSFSEFVRGWGPYAKVLWEQAQLQPIVIEGHKVQVLVR